MAQTEQQRIEGELAESIPEFYDDVLKIVIQYLGHAWPSDWMRWLKHPTALITNGSRTVQAPDNQWNIVVGDPPAFVGSYGFRICVHGLGPHLHLGVALIAPQFTSMSSMSVQSSLALTENSSEGEGSDDEPEDQEEERDEPNSKSKSKSRDGNRSSRRGMVGADRESSSRLLREGVVPISYEMVLYSLSPGSIYYPCKINNSIFRHSIQDSDDLSLNSENSAVSSSSEVSQVMDPFFLDSSGTSSHHSRFSKFSSRHSVSSAASSSSQASSSNPQRSSKLWQSRTAATPPCSSGYKTKANICRPGDIIDVHVHLHSTQQEENWVTFSHQKKLPIVIKCPNWSDYIKRGYLLRPIAFLAGKENCVTIYPFHEDEGDIAELDTSATQREGISLSGKAQIFKSRSASASFGAASGNHEPQRKKWGSGGIGTELGMNEGRSSCIVS